MPDTVVYLGPSLSRSEACSILQADYLPPICRGDLAKLPDEVKTVGIIDGEFCQQLAVSSKEILVLLDRGVSIFGAASMGALRAAETHIFGTIGVGEIFRMFRDGVLDADDEVAVVYDPQSYRQLSDPLVNLRHVVKMAREANVIDEAEMNRLISEMKSWYFPDRSHSALQSLCPALVDFLRGAAIPDLKRDDARELLYAIKTSHETKSLPQPL
jgi:hypothetical protein